MAQKLLDALQKIATGEIVGESKNYEDSLYIVRNIAKEAIEDYFKNENKIYTMTANVPQPWDERLVKAFGDQINEEGWLTPDWAQYLEDNFKDWDIDGIETNEKKELFGLMYNLDFEFSLDGGYIRPVQQKVIDMAPKRLFQVDEEINHKKYGTGKVKEVFENKIVILFSDDKELKFLTYLFEQNLI